MTPNDDRSTEQACQVGQDQQQCGGEQNESCLTYLVLFEHGCLPFCCYSCKPDGVPVSGPVEASSGSRFGPAINGYTTWDAATLPPI